MPYPWRVVLICLAGLSSVAQSATQIDTARAKALAWLMTNQSGEGKWSSASGADVIPTSAVLDAFALFGIKGYPYTKGLTWLANTDGLSNDATARKIITLSKAGMNVSALASQLIAMRNVAGDSWGSYAGYAGSFPDSSLALDAINTAKAIYSNMQWSIAYIGYAQNTTISDTANYGGWSFVKGLPNSPQLQTKSQIIPTVYNILAFNHLKSTYPSFVSQSALDNAVAWLKNQQKGGGGFGDGTNGTVLETALAYQAIVAEKGVADSAAVSAQTFLLGQQLPDYSWSDDALTTALVLQTFPAIVMLDTDKDGVPDDVEPYMNMNPNIADSRWLANKGNGANLPGVTTAMLVTTGTVGQAFTPLSLTASGGTPPYSWSVASGTLPPGMSLSIAGVISGTPTAAGSYSFTYAVKDATATPVTGNFVGQIDIASGVAILKDGDLNGDGVVDVADVALAERFALGLAVPTPEQLYRGDVSPAAGDLVIDAADVAKIRRKALGLDTSF